MQMHFSDDPYLESQDSIFFFHGYSLLPWVGEWGLGSKGKY